MQNLTDHDTMKRIGESSCGFVDSLQLYSDNQTYAQLSEQAKWNITDLTYKISKYSKKIAPDIIDIEVRKAFDAWSSVTDLVFTQKDGGQVHINIRLVSKTASTHQ